MKAKVRENEREEREIPAYSMIDEYFASEATQVECVILCWISPRHSHLITILKQILALPFLNPWGTLPSLPSISELFKKTFHSDTKKSFQSKSVQAAYFVCAHMLLQFNNITLTCHFLKSSVHMNEYHCVPYLGPWAPSRQKERGRGIERNCCTVMYDVKQYVKESGLLP